MQLGLCRSDFVRAGVLRYGLPPNVEPVTVVIAPAILSTVCTAAFNGGLVSTVRRVRGGSMFN